MHFLVGAEWQVTVEELATVALKTRRITGRTRRNITTREEKHWSIIECAANSSKIPVVLMNERSVVCQSRPGTEPINPDPDLRPS